MLINFFSNNPPETNWNDVEQFEKHIHFKKRIRKTMYQNSKTKKDRPSLSLTELAVDYVNHVSPRKLGSVDMYWASSVCSGTYVSSCTLMMALMYAKRLKSKDALYLDNVSSSDLFFVSMLVASKYLVDEGEDEETTLDEWMTATNLDSEDIHQLEREFLHAIDWNLYVSNEEFWSFLLKIEKKIAWRQYSSRNQKFFTYTDLNILTSNSSQIDVGQHCFKSILAQLILDSLKVTAYCLAAYIVGICSIAATPHLISQLRTLNSNSEVASPGMELEVTTPITVSLVNKKFFTLDELVKKNEEDVLSIERCPSCRSEVIYLNNNVSNDYGKERSSKGCFCMKKNISEEMKSQVYSLKTIEDSFQQPLNMKPYLNIVNETSVYSFFMLPFV